MFYSIPVDGTCDKTVDGCKDVGDTGDDDDYKVSFVSKNKYLFRLCRVSREKKIGNVLSLTITRHFLNQTPSIGLRHPSFRKVPESDARSAVLNTSKLYKVHEQHQRFVLKHSLILAFPFLSSLLWCSNLQKFVSPGSNILLLFWLMIFFSGFSLFLFWNAYDFF